jgi:threonine/homoserine/homoserine lactone efflux protein
MKVLPFLAVVAVILVTPGVDMALVTRNAIVRGRRAALATAVGVNLGVAVWTIAAATGLAALFAASSAAFDAVRLAGAAYLVVLGLLSLRSARGGFAPTGPTAAPTRDRDALRQGLFCNLLNPKMAIFFTSLLPQFTANGSAGLGQLLALGAIFNLLGLVWLTTYALAAARSGHVLRRPRVRARLEYLTGFILVGLGIRVALEGARR